MEPDLEEVRMVFSLPSDFDPKSFVYHLSFKRGGPLNAIFQFLLKFIEVLLFIVFVLNLFK